MKNPPFSRRAGEEVIEACEETIAKLQSSLPVRRMAMVRVQAMVREPHESIE
jgi:hypothetical protein